MATKSAPKTTDAIALLKADHRAVEALFAHYERAKDSKRKKSLASQISPEVTP